MRRSRRRRGVHRAGPVTRTAKASPGAVLVRYVPAIAVVVALVVAACADRLGRRDHLADAEPVERGALPLTFDEAAGAGRAGRLGPAVRHDDRAGRGAALVRAAVRRTVDGR